MSTESFRDWLCWEIREVLGHQSAQPPLLVWCDPHRALLDLLRETARADGFEQKAGLLAAAVLAKKDVDKAIADRANWRSDDRRWVREGKLPQPGWWPEEKHNG